MGRIAFPFFLAAITVFVCALSQIRLGTDALQLYQEADNNYQKALQLNSEKKSNEAEEEALNRQALNQFIVFLKTAPKNVAQIDSLRFFALLKAGELAHYFDSLTTALSFYNTAIDIKRKLPQLNDSFLFRPYMLSGLIYTRQNKLDSAIQYLKQAESIQAQSHLELQESERLYNILGSIYYEYGNYKQAKNYFLRATEVLSPGNPSYDALRVNYQLNLAATLQKLEDYNGANSIYQALLHEETSFENEINNHLGLIQLSLGAPKQALVYFKRVQYNSALAVGLCNDIANAFLTTRMLDSAKKYLQLAVQKNLLYNNNNLSIDYGRTLKTYGDLEKLTGHPSRALHSYQQALHHFYPAFTDTAVQANPERFSGAFSYINLFQTLVAKAEALQLLYQQSGSLSPNIQALAAYQSAFHLIEYVERTYESDEARLFLGKIKYAVHNKPIDIAFALYKQTGDKKYLESLYLFDQQNKATALALSRQISTLLAATQSPLLKEEQTIKSNITRLSIRAAQVTDSLQQTTINQSIRDYEIQLSKVQEKINQQGNIKETNVPSIATLQASLLTKSSTLVSYHLFENKITTLVITPEDVTCFQRSLPENFHEALDSFLTQLKNPSGKITDLHKNDFYSLLLSDVPFQKTKQLIIIPDEILNYLPFESLQNKEGRYLIEQVAVQYQYSTALLKRDETELADAPILSFAPFTEDSSGALTTLVNSKHEVETLNGKTFLDTSATKSNFLQNCGAFKIVHLATHAVVNNEAENLSYIAFSPRQQDHLLYEQEIYNLPLRETDLVILSACETSAGHFVKGEGIMSLSRAFTYAGCSNIITSLWKADDFSTAYLTTRIHRYLDKNFSITEAVRQAKLDYLNDKSIHPRLKQPYYWSHLIFIGDVNAEKKLQGQWFLIAGLAMVLLTLLFIKKSRKAGR